jgi:c-di-GMP-binding flagellar brake protein YcgR
VNLSADGCLMVFKKPQNLSQDTMVELTFTVNEMPFRVWGRVRAIRSDTAIGFQFPLMSSRVRKRLEDLIEQLIEDFIARSMRGGAKEKRRFPRIECTGTAGVKIPTGEEAYPATIVNLSAGGCLMVLHKPQRLAQDAAVELEFKVNDLPFRVKGQVKAVRSEAKVGFQFLQLNTKVQRQLEDLIDDLIKHVVKRIAERAEVI